LTKCKGAWIAIDPSFELSAILDSLFAEQAERSKTAKLAKIIFIFISRIIHVFNIESKYVPKKNQII
jgi:hypothetical protein